MDNISNMERKTNKIDFSVLPGQIVGNVYKFPTIATTTSTGRAREWNIRVELKDAAGNGVKIKPSMLNYSVRLPDGYIAEIYKETSQVGGKIAKADSTSITTGKNIGKANETSVLTQALTVAARDYTLQLRKASSDVPLPMLGQPYANNIDFSREVYVEPKLDGVHVVLYKDGCYSRNGLKYTGLQYIRDELAPVFAQYPGIYLDGEMYEHGLPLQDISGRVRRGIGETGRISFHMFDCFYTVKDKPFSERLSIRRAIFEQFQFQYVKLVPTHQANDLATVERIFNKYVTDGYEGVMIKYGDAKYHNSVGNSHSSEMLKMKKRESSEFIVVGFETGVRGKEANAIILICDNGRGKQFKPMMRGWSIEERVAMARHGADYVGKKVTVEYEALSKDGTPLRGYIVAIRDYE